MSSRMSWIVVIGSLVSGTARAQVPSCIPPSSGPGSYGPFQQWKYVPKPPPNWSYYGLDGGPELTTDYPFAGFPGYRGSFGTIFTNGPHLSRTPVPVYTPIPAVYGVDCFDRHSWNNRKRTLLGIGQYGWFGPFGAAVHPRPIGVSVWPEADPRANSKHHRYPIGTPQATPGCLTLTVKVQPNAEIFVEGVKTTQTGSDRLFESPPLSEDKDYSYVLVARWVEAGVPVERRQVASGRSGDVVAVDFTAGTQK